MDDRGPLRSYSGNPYLWFSRPVLVGAFGFVQFMCDNTDELHQDKHHIYQPLNVINHYCKSLDSSEISNKLINHDVELFFTSHWIPDEPDASIPDYAATDTEKDLVWQLGKDQDIYSGLVKSISDSLCALQSQLRSFDPLSQQKRKVGSAW